MPRPARRRERTLLHRLSGQARGRGQLRLHEFKWRGVERVSLLGDGAHLGIGAPVVQRDGGKIVKGEVEVVADVGGREKGLARDFDGRLAEPLVERADERRPREARGGREASRRCELASWAGVLI